MNKILQVANSGHSVSNSLGIGCTSTEQSSVDSVYDKILTRIINGELVSGEVLICTRLADELDVSRTPVVSAIDRLVSDGILAKENNRRARVKETAETWLDQIHHLRELVEPPAAGLAAKYITDEALQKLEKLAELATPGISDTWQQAAGELDLGVHLSIADHCRNMPLRETIYRCWKFKRVSCQLGRADPESVETKHREHLAILSALSQHDSDTATAAMMFHLRSALCSAKVH